MLKEAFGLSEHPRRANHAGMKGLIAEGEEVVEKGQGPRMRRGNSR
jgi:hypothetical protein